MALSLDSSSYNPVAKSLHATGDPRPRTVDGQNIQTLDNFDPPHPQIFKVLNFFQGLGWVDKTNQTPQHQLSCALA